MIDDKFKTFSSLAAVKQKERKHLEHLELLSNQGAPGDAAETREKALLTEPPASACSSFP